jgi:hypothetical protein
MHSLRDFDGQGSEDPKMIASIVRNFYKWLYSSEDTNAEDQATLLNENQT